MKESLTIRRSIDEDIPALAGIVSENYTKETAEHFVTEIEQSFSSNPFRPWFYTALAGTQPVGCAGYNASWLTWGAYSLCWVNVASRVQKQGVGRALVDKCIADLRPRASLLILATTVPDFYSNNWGFERLMDFSDQLADTLMALKL